MRKFERMLCQSCVPYALVSIDRNIIADGNSTDALFQRKRSHQPKEIPRNVDASGNLPRNLAPRIHSIWRHKDGTVTHSDMNPKQSKNKQSRQKLSLR
ncbi:hypothetical protein TNCV_4554521 [Trichonephila clavipes]|nr:hypothetical protein TNCV_4554521 [Trichonephila clavipes]